MTKKRAKGLIDRTEEEAELLGTTTTYMWGPKVRKKSPFNKVVNEWGLTNMQEAFCQHYVITGDLEVSVKKAGYQHPDRYFDAFVFGRKLLRSRKIKARIEQIKGERMEEYKSQFKHTVDAVVEGLWTIYTKAVAAEDFAGANRALELLGKNLNMFVEQRELKVKGFESSGDPEEMKRDISRLVKTLGLHKELH